MNLRISPLFGCAVKTCTGCGNDYPATREFFSPDGHGEKLASKCKSCRTGLLKSWYWRRGRTQRRQARALGGVSNA